MQIKTLLILTLILLVVGLKAQKINNFNSKESAIWTTPNNRDNNRSEIIPDKHCKLTYYTPQKEKLSLPLRSSVKNIWGKEIALYYALFEDAYVYEEQPIEGDPNVVIRIRKPRIYKSIKGIESYFKKKLKKGNCSITTASQQMKQILKIGIAAVSEDSSWLENELKKQKSKEGQIALYNKIILINI